MAAFYVRAEQFPRKAGLDCRLFRACEHGHYDIVSSIGDMMAPSMSRLFLTLFVGASYAAWIALRGPITGVDTGSYERWADALIAAHFHYVDYYTQQQFMIPLPLYSGWITMVALSKMAAGSSWQLVLLAVNAAAITVTAWTIVSIATGWRRTAAAVALLAAGDLLLFAPYVLSDVLFMAVSAVTVAALISRHPARTLAGGVLAAVTRPTSPPLLATVALRWCRVTRWAAARPGIGVAVFGLVTLAVVTAHAVILQADILTGSPWITYVRSGYAAGAVITDRPATYLGAFTTVPGAIALTVLRMIAFFSPWAPGYSTAHTALNLVFFVPLYIACIRAVRRADDREAVVTLLCYLLCVSGFHAMQEIDFDHRFRLPAIPALIMLATLRDGLPATNTSDQRPQIAQTC